MTKQIDLFDYSETEIIDPMTKDEAELWIVEVETTGQRLGQLLYEGYKRDAWRVLGYGSWTQCVKELAERSGFKERYAFYQMEHERLINDVLHANDLLHRGAVNENRVPERQTRPLSKLETDDEKREVWQRAAETAPDGRITATHVEETVKEYQEQKAHSSVIRCQVCSSLYDSETFGNGCPYCYKEKHNLDGWVENLPEQMKRPVPKTKDYIKLAEWQSLNQNEQSEILIRSYPNNTIFNKTNDNIEWARWSWNPVTGCLHNCAYCYARDIAARFFPQNFEPSFLPARLKAPDNTRLPDFNKINNPIDKMGWRNVFVCSMADLFGKWVPEEWINAVLESITRNPQWTFLLLTKFPVRMAEFSYPDNVWLGTTVDYQHAVKRAESAFVKIKASGFNGVCWLSCEPMMENLQFTSLDMFDWVVMGGASKSSQTPEFCPPFDWIVNLYNQARKANCKIYQKTNLIPGMNNSQRVKEYP